MLMRDILSGLMPLNLCFPAADGDLGGRLLRRGVSLEGVDHGVRTLWGIPPPWV